MEFFQEALDSLEKRYSLVEVLSLVDSSWYTRWGVHFGLWQGAISSQGSMDQAALWLPKTFLLNISGCFAMTELGRISLNVWIDL